MAVTFSGVYSGSQILVLLNFFRVYIQLWEVKEANYVMEKLIPFPGSSLEEQKGQLPLRSLENDSSQGKASYQERQVSSQWSRGGFRLFLYSDGQIVF